MWLSASCSQFTAETASAPDMDVLNVAALAQQLRQRHQSCKQADCSPHERACEEAAALLSPEGSCSTVARSMASTVSYHEFLVLARGSPPQAHADRQQARMPKRNLSPRSVPDLLGTQLSACHGDWLGTARSCCSHSHASCPSPTLQALEDNRGPEAEASAICKHSCKQAAVQAPQRQCSRALENSCTQLARN